MAEILYATEATLEGPWLLDRRALEELEKVVEGEWQGLNQSLQDKLEQEAEEQLERGINRGYYKNNKKELARIKKEIHADPPYWARSEKTLTLGFSDGGSFISDSFNKPLRESTLYEKTATELDYSLKSADIQAGIHCSGKRLRINASPNNAQVARELYVSLRQWADKYRPPIWQRIWVWLDGWQWPIYIVFAFASLLALASVKSPAKLEIEKLGKSLIDSGINQTNLFTGIKVLLQLQLNYFPSSTTTSTNIPLWFWLIVVGGLVISTVISLHPKTILGIGRGERKIGFWRLWMNLVGITLPSLLFVSIVWPQLITFIVNLF